MATMTGTAHDQDPWKPVVREFARNLDMGKDWKPIPIQPAINLAWRPASRLGSYSVPLSLSVWDGTD